MTPAEATRLRILSLASVTSLIGQRCYAVVFPQKFQWPAARVQDIGQIETLQLRGLVGVVRGRVQVEVCSGMRSGVSPLDEARSVMAAIDGDIVNGVVTGLRGWSGTVGSPAVTVDSVIPADYREFFEELGTDRIYRVQKDYFVKLRH